MAFDKSKPLDAWLHRVEARELWVAVLMNGNTITGYLINNHVAVVLRYYAHGKVTGWELLVPASTENNTAATLDGAAQVLGVDGCRELV